MKVKEAKYPVKTSSGRAEGFNSGVKGLKM
jgi:hypothetical protein